MKGYKVTFKEQDVELYTEGEDRHSTFLASLPTGPVKFYAEQDPAGKNHWKEEDYGETELAEELGEIVERLDLPFMK